MATPDFSEPRAIDRDRLASAAGLATVECHETLDSTNDRAKSLAGDPATPLPALVLADEQTAGRGRGGNRWWTGSGSLAFSLLVDTEAWNLPQNQLPLTALVAGIAVVETVSACVPKSTVGLHWPNDVYADGRKLAGILVEAPTANRLVVGVGINTNCRLEQAPLELRDRVATLFDLTGTLHDHCELLIAWCRSWQGWVSQLLEHPNQVGNRANELCLQHGQRLRLRQGDRVHEGTCLGIAPDGALRLEGPDGVQQFYSGTLG